VRRVNRSVIRKGSKKEGNRSPAGTTAPAGRPKKISKRQDKAGSISPPEKKRNEGKNSRAPVELGRKGEEEEGKRAGHFLAAEKKRGRRAPPSSPSKKKKKVRTGKEKRDEKKRHTGREKKGGVVRSVFPGRKAGGGVGKKKTQEQPHELFFKKKKKREERTSPRRTQRLEGKTKGEERKSGPRYPGGKEKKRGKRK